MVAGVLTLGSWVSANAAHDPSASPDLIIAFGTSLTAGGHWLEPLSAALQDCFGHPVRVEAVARAGASSAWGAAAVDGIVARKPDVVLVEFATNDAALNRWMTPWRSRANLRSILQRLSGASPPPHVIVMAMNPVSDRAGWVRPFLNTYEDGHRAVAAETGASFLDMRPRWKKLPREDLRRGIPDGLHPSPAVVTKLLVPALVPMIAEGRCRDRLDRSDSASPLNADAAAIFSSPAAQSIYYM